MLFCNYCGCGIADNHCKNCTQIKIRLERILDNLNDSYRFTCAGSDARRSIARLKKSMLKQIAAIDEARADRIGIGL